MYSDLPTDVHVRFNKELLIEIDKGIARLYFSNRSHAIRRAMKEFIENHSHEWNGGSHSKRSMGGSRLDKS